MVMAHDGFAKLIEECGELIQVAGKVLQIGDVNAPHWSGDLHERLIEEMGDVFAAIAYVADATGIEYESVNARKRAKLELYRTWGNNDIVDAS